jgi:hypothetical protein
VDDDEYPATRRNQRNVADKFSGAVDLGGFFVRNIAAHLPQ